MASLSPADQQRVEALERLLGHRFSNRGQALTALTHSSFVNEHRSDPAHLDDNERLEFLGDAVVDLVASDCLMRLFPQAREGELSSLRASIVDEHGLAEVARAGDLGALLRLGRGETLSGGRSKPSILADTLEAILGALYLEAGFDAVKQCFEKLFAAQLARLTAGETVRDFKSALQEWTQAKLKTAPAYRLVSAEGPDHAKHFCFEVEVSGRIVGRGTGKSKKDAEQAAAQMALGALKAEPNA